MASREYCTNIFYEEYKVKIDAGKLCAGGVKELGPCGGDSGSPLMAFNDTDRLEKYWYLAGMTVFWPKQCALEGVPRVYTRINYYYDWILTKLQ